MDLSYIASILPKLLEGALQSLKIFIVTLAISLPLGLPCTLGLISRFAPARFIAKVYVWIFRGTPLMLQLFFVYYCLPMISPLVFDRMAAVLVTFSFNYSAYFSEIYRAGIQSIDSGQFEAAKSLGFSYTKTLGTIIIPQAIRNIIPPVSNEVITLVKDTALVYSIGVPELLKAAKDINNADVDPTSYFIAALIYLIVTFVLTMFSNHLEQRYSRFDRAVA